MTKKEIEADVDAELSEIRTPMKAIRKKCLDCSGGSSNEVQKCVIPSCPLYPFRLGKNPFRKPMSEERKTIMRERMQEMRAAGKFDK